MKIKKIIAIVLCFCITFCFAACGNSNTGVSSESQSLSYEERCDLLTSYANEGESDKALLLYDELYAEAVDAFRYYNECDIEQQKDVTSSIAAEKQVAADLSFQTMKAQLCTAAAALANGKTAEAFKSHIGNDYIFNQYKEYTAYGDEFLELREEEKTLIAEYLEILNRSGDYTFEHEGRTYTLDELYYLDITDDEYNRYLEQCYGAINADAGEIYIKLVKIRNRMAELAGYDSYAQYQDTAAYARDYSEDSVKALKQAAKDVAAEMDFFYYYVFNSCYEELDLDADELLDNVEDIFSEISELPLNAVRFMRENNYCSLDTDECRSTSAFAVDFAGDAPAYLFYTPCGSSVDYEYISHELGHYTAMINTINPNPVILPGNYDLSEVHSTGLQILFSLKALPLYEEYGELAQAADLTDLIMYVEDGCMIDDWERLVYADPDITLEKANQYYVDVLADYGIEEYTAMQYDWMWVNHVFEFPLYYLSYAVSGFSSLQIWSMAVCDFDAAVDVWENFINSDIYTRGYCDVARECGLKLFDEEGVAQDIVYAAVDSLWDIAEENGLLDW